MLHTPRTICLHANSGHQGQASQLITPQTLGHRVKPFLSLEVMNAGEVLASREASLSSSNEVLVSSDSGTATIIFLLAGKADFSDSTHKQGCLKQHDVLWILSGSGVQYSLTPKTPDCICIKLRIALSPALERAPAQSIYLDSALIERDGPAQILLGQHGGASSPLALPALINYLVVTLAAGQAWVYEPPVNHRIAWIVVVSGKVTTSDVLIAANEIAAYENSHKSIRFLAEENCVFVLGSSQEYTHDLAVEKYSLPSRGEIFTAERADGSEPLRELMCV